MLDAEIERTIKTLWEPAVQSRVGLESVVFAQASQRRQVGTPTGPYVFFVKLFDRPHGFPRKQDVWDDAAQEFLHIETQAQLTTYQITALVPQGLTDPVQMSESDVLNVARGRIQADALAGAFRAAGLSPLRVTEVRNPIFLDDFDQFEAAPSFDVVFSHSLVDVSSVPAVSSTETQFNRA